jgi:hypothetical protein
MRRDGIPAAHQQLDRQLYIAHLPGGVGLWDSIHLSARDRPLWSGMPRYRRLNPKILACFCMAE